MLLDCRHFVITLDSFYRADRFHWTDCLEEHEKKAVLVLSPGKELCYHDDTSSGHAGPWLEVPADQCACEGMWKRALIFADAQAQPCDGMDMQRVQINIIVPPGKDSYDVIAAICAGAELTGNAAYVMHITWLADRISTNYQHQIALWEKLQQAVKTTKDQVAMLGEIDRECSREWGERKRALQALYADAQPPDEEVKRLADWYGNERNRRRQDSLDTHPVPVKWNCLSLLMNAREETDRHSRDLLLPFITYSGCAAEDSVCHAYKASRQSLEVGNMVRMLREHLCAHTLRQWRDTYSSPGDGRLWTLILGNPELGRISNDSDRENFIRNELLHDADSYYPDTAALLLCDLQFDRRNGNDVLDEFRRNNPAYDAHALIDRFISNPEQSAGLEPFAQWGNDWVLGVKNRLCAEPELLNAAAFLAEGGAWLNWLDDVIKRREVHDIEGISDQGRLAFGAKVKDKKRDKNAETLLSGYRRAYESALFFARLKVMRMRAAEIHAAILDLIHVQDEVLQPYLLTDRQYVEIEKLAGHLVADLKNALSTYDFHNAKHSYLIQTEYSLEAYRQWIVNAMSGAMRKVQKIVGEGKSMIGVLQNALPSLLAMMDETRSIPYGPDEITGRNRAWKRKILDNRLKDGNATSDVWFVPLHLLLCIEAYEFDIAANAPGHLFLEGVDIPRFRDHSESREQGSEQSSVAQPAMEDSGNAHAVRLVDSNQRRYLTWRWDHLIGSEMDYADVTICTRDGNKPVFEKKRYRWSDYSANHGLEIDNALSPGTAFRVTIAQLYHDPFFFVFTTPSTQGYASFRVIPPGLFSRGKMKRVEACVRLENGTSAHHLRVCKRAKSSVFRYHPCFFEKSRAQSTTVWVSGTLLLGEKEDISCLSIEPDYGYESQIRIVGE